MRPLRAIRLKCLDCCCGQRNEVKLCPSNDCPLWEFRFGKLPKNDSRKKKNLTEEQRFEIRERLLRGRELKKQKEIET